MSVLWDLGSGTVAEVREELAEREEYETAYNTVLTLLRSLRKKQWVTVLHEDRAHRYYPAAPLADARNDALRLLLHRYFDGSPESLIQHVVKDSARLQWVAWSAQGHAAKSRSQG